MVEIASTIGSLILDNEGHLKRKCISSPTSNWHNRHLLLDSIYIPVSGIGTGQSLFLRLVADIGNIIELLFFIFLQRLSLACTPLPEVTV